MQEYAQEIGADCSINAYAETKVADLASQLDVVLIGPQIKYYQKRIEEICAPYGTKVMVISNVDFRPYGWKEGTVRCICAAGEDLMKRKELENRMLQALQEGNDCAPLWKRFFSYVIDYFLSTILISLIPMIATSILTGEKAFTSENFTAIPMGMEDSSKWRGYGCSCVLFLHTASEGDTQGADLGKKDSGGFGL